MKRSYLIYDGYFDLVISFIRLTLDATIKKRVLNIR